MPEPKIVIIGLDAAVQTLLKPWAEQGKLPNLAALMKDGVSGDLESVVPPLTPAAWTTFMTGKNPGKHGIYNFMEQAQDGYGMLVINGGNRKAETVWSILNRDGLTTGIMNTPFTYPPEKLDGFQISGLDAPSPESAFVHPPELKKEIQAKFGELQMDSRHLGAMTNLKKRAETLEAFKSTDDQWTQLAIHLLEKHPQDVMMFTFMSIDSVQHHFWHYMDKTHFFHDPEGAEQFHDAILKVYQRLDRMVGDIVSRVDRSKTHILVVSDHGQAGVSDRTLYINRVLSQAGLLYYKPVNPVTGLTKAVVGPVFNFLQSNLNHAQKEWLAGLFPGLRQGAGDMVTSFGDIDWTRTKAYCNEAWATPPSVCINLKGVKPEGIVEPADYEKVIQQAMEVLYAVKDPVTGKQLVENVYRRGEIYSGPYFDRAPDLTLNWWGSSPYNTKPSLRSEQHEPALKIEKPEPLCRPEWSGHHTLDGIFIAQGPRLKAGLAGQHARLLDMAPTMLYLLGQPIPDDMDGKVLLDWFQAEAAQGDPTYEDSSQNESAALVNAQAEYSAEEASLVEERLKNLGYLE